MSIFSCNGHALAAPDAPESGEPGCWTRDEFVEMDARFAAALESAFRSGEESRASARTEYDVARGSPAVALARARRLTEEAAQTDGAQTWAW